MPHRCLCSLLQACLLMWWDIPSFSGKQPVASPPRPASMGLAGEMPQYEHPSFHWTQC